MHPSSMKKMKMFVSRYLGEKPNLLVLDVGSKNVFKPEEEGSYRGLFSKPGWNYVGLDLSSGRNVDVVCQSAYDWGLNKQFDVIVSGQCLEHVEDTKAWVQELNKNLKPGGLVCIIAPWQWCEHRDPVDCWRILPDGMRFLLEKVAGLKVHECFIEEKDCVGIAEKIKI